MIYAVNEKIKSHLIMLLFSLFVAGSFVFGKLYAELIEPEILTFYRFLLGATPVSYTHLTLPTKASV